MEKNESKPIRKRGGQPGNQNARKHGFYTIDGRKRIEDMDELIQDCRALLQAIKEGDHHAIQERPNRADGNRNLQHKEFIHGR